ncbi:hypothetical protein [Amycolatopsis anabasis]|uniref:nSTAND1 domain-containing NTPase n=1 Tax=Amycolatopsis anabasis TaxID=1840409 RepID=UPI00131ADD22|nr:hypothetical protein [Amycolatopsis anabasis]
MPRRERPLEPGDDVLLRFAAGLRSLREKAGSPTYRELGKLAGYSAAALSDAAGGRKLPSLPLTLAYVDACLGDTAEWEARWRATAAELAAREPEADEETRAPYLGLAPFQPADADRFFGREKVLAELLARVRERRFVGVFGASGSGKSSLLRAGLVAELTGDGRRSAAVLTPGPHPMAKHGNRLSELNGDALENDQLLVVDQFEEVFTLCPDPEERNRFIDGLLAAANGRARVVLGVRADFYGHCGRHPGLVDALRDAQVLIGPMSPDELRAAITEPALRTGCRVETALVSRLISDATGQPAVLPLVSHAMLETWRRRQGLTLTVAGYEAAGGIQDAIARSAENVYTGLDEGQRQVARQIFLRLTALGEGTEDTKRRISRRELDESDPDTGVVLEELAHARLLALDNEGIDIAHEALIRSWPRLREWLADDREGLRVHRQLTEATDAWESLDRDPGSLYRGVRLARAQGWADAHESALTAREREFLDASLAAEAAERAAARRRTRRLRQLVALLSVLLVVAVAATVYAVRAEDTATEQRNIALVRKAVSDAAGLRAANPALSTQLSLAAYRMNPLPEARDGLLGAFHSPYSTRLTGHTETVGGVAFSRDSRVMASTSADRTARLWDVADPRHTRELAVLRGHSDVVFSAVFSPDGRTLATMSRDHTVRLWDVTDPARARELVTLNGHTSYVYAAAFSPDGSVLASVSADRTTRLWSVADGREITAFGAYAGTVGAVAFSPDGRILATAGDFGARLWEVADLRSPREIAVLTGHTAPVSGVAFSPDGRTLATSSHDRTARLWEVTEPRAPALLSVLTGHTHPIYGVTFSPDGRFVATAGSDNSARLWDVADRRAPRQAARLLGHTDSVNAVAFSPDGRTLSSTGDTTVRLDVLSELNLHEHGDGIKWVAYRPDGKVLATGGHDNTARLWDVAADPLHPRLLAIITGHSQVVWHVAFSPDGRTLATAAYDGTVRLWDVADPRAPAPFGVLPRLDGELQWVEFSPDGRWLATATAARAARLWDVTDLRNPVELATITAHPEPVHQASFSPDGRLLATSSADRTTRIWDVADPRAPRELARLPEGSLAFRPDGRVLATGTRENGVRLWDLGDPARPQALGLLTGHTNFVYGLAFSPDGRRFTSGSADRTARLWDVSDPRAPVPLGVFAGSVGPAINATFSPDGRLLATSVDFAPAVWDPDPDRVAARVCDLAHPRITPEEWSQYFPGVAYQPPCGP